jgi:hypothetical protein
MDNALPPNRRQEPVPVLGVCRSGGLVLKNLLVWRVSIEMYRFFTSLSIFIFHIKRHTISNIEGIVVDVMLTRSSRTNQLSYLLDVDTANETSP